MNPKSHNDHEEVKAQQLKRNSQSVLDSSSSAVSSVLKEEPVFAPNPSLFSTGLKQSLEIKLPSNSTTMKQSRNQVMIPEEKEMNGLSKLQEESNTSVRSPERIQEYTLPEDTKNRKEKIKTIFWKYCKVSDETGSIYLNLRQYIKLLQDSHILDTTKMTKPKAEVIFVSIAGKKGMTFEGFFQSLIKLAELKYKNLYSSSELEALEEIVAKHLMPLYRTLSNNNSSPIKTLIPFDLITYDSTIKAMMNSVLPVLQDIYNIYFGELFKKVKTTEQMSQITTKQIVTFARDFELLNNGFLSKSMLFSMLDMIINNSEKKLTNNLDDSKIFYSENVIGDNYFTLGRFFILIFWVAVNGFQGEKYEVPQCTNSEKLYLLLAKMEVSKGFTQISKKCFKHNSLLPIAECIRKEIIANPLSYQTNTKTSYTSEDSKQLSFTLEDDNFKRIFMANASLNVDSNVTKMTCFKFITLLKDTGLIKPKASPLSTMDMQLLFTKALNLNDENNKQEEVKKDKLDYRRFYWIITQIAMKLYPDVTITEAQELLYDKVSVYINVVF